MFKRLTKFITKFWTHLVVYSIKLLFQKFGKLFSSIFGSSPRDMWLDCWKILGHESTIFVTSTKSLPKMSYQNQANCWFEVKSMLSKISSSFLKQPKISSESFKVIPSVVYKRSKFVVQVSNDIDIYFLRDFVAWHKIWHRGDHL